MIADTHAQAMVFDEPGKPLRPTSLPLPELGPGELLVRVRACTVCGSDLHSYTGRRWQQENTILGHEITGTIERLPPGEPVLDYHGTPLREGDRVVWGLVASCGACVCCHRGLPMKCVHMVKYGHMPLFYRVKLTGGLSTHCHVVPGTPIFRIPDEVPDTVAAQASCATATAAACFRHAGDVRGARVLVFGAGLLGLTATAMAHHAGARAVLVTDPDRRRLELASKFGATNVVRYEGHDLRHAGFRLTGTDGFDVAFEMSGSADAVETAIHMVGLGGRAVLAGSVLHTRSASFVPEMVVRWLQTIQGVHNYLPADLATAVTFLGQEHTRYPFAELVSKTFPLAEADAAFRYAEKHRPVRVAVVP